MCPFTRPAAGDIAQMTYQLHHMLGATPHTTCHLANLCLCQHTKSNCAMPFLSNCHMPCLSHATIHIARHSGVPLPALLARITFPAAQRFPTDRYTRKITGGGAAAFVVELTLPMCGHTPSVELNLVLAFNAVLHSTHQNL